MPALAAYIGTLGFLIFLGYWQGPMSGDRRVLIAAAMAFIICALALPTPTPATAAAMAVTVPVYAWMACKWFLPTLLNRLRGR